MKVRVASCAYPIEQVTSFERFAHKQEHWVREAALAGAQLLVFPEYASLELTAALAPNASVDLATELALVQTFLAPMLALYTTLAQRHGVYILSPSFPERMTTQGDPAPRYHNRARLHAPTGGVAVQEKLQMTRFERELWGVSPGALQQVSETALGVLGVAICYDSEFPLIVRRQVEAGAQIVLVPSCTDTLAGYHRVELSCRARALENQCYVVQAPTVGAAPWSRVLDENRGAAGVYGPVDQGFAPDGVVARGSLDHAGWVYAELDLDALERVRRTGQVTNFRDFSTSGHLAGSVSKISI